jgi:hypothetical protein
LGYHIRCGPFLGGERVSGVFVEERLVAIHLSGRGPIASHVPQGSVVQLIQGG